MSKYTFSDDAARINFVLMPFEILYNAKFFIIKGAWNFVQISQLCFHAPCNNFIYPCVVSTGKSNNRILLLLPLGVNNASEHN